MKGLEVSPEQREGQGAGRGAGGGGRGRGQWEGRGLRGRLTGSSLSRGDQSF